MIVFSPKDVNKEYVRPEKQAQVDYLDKTLRVNKNMKSDIIYMIASFESIREGKR